MANLINFKGFCAPLAMLPGLSSFVMLKQIIFATRQSRLSLSLTVAKRIVENMPFGVLTLHVTCHKVSSPSRFFLATEFFFFATILHLKVSLEHCLYNFVCLYRDQQPSVTHRKPWTVDEQEIFEQGLVSF